MLGEILAGAAEQGADTRLIHLNELNMKGCQGCLACREKLGQCAYKDDLQDVLEEMRNCDAVAVGTPIYMFSFTGQFKCFLDRCFCFIAMQEGEKVNYQSVLPGGKKFALVTSQGNDDPEEYRRVIRYLEMLFSFLSGSSIEVITQAGTDEKNSALNDASLLEKARALGHTLAS
jgi:multimeric flavodoxin WrbA